MRDFVSQVWLAISRRPLTYLLAVLSLGIGGAAFLCVSSMGEAMLGMLGLDPALFDERPLIMANVREMGVQRGVAFEAAEIVRVVRSATGREVAVSNPVTQVNLKVSRLTLSNVDLVANSGNRLTAPFLGPFEKVIGRPMTVSDDRSGALVCLLGKSVAWKLFPAGKAPGQTVRIDGVRFRIVGIYEGSPLRSGDEHFDQVMVPFATAQKYYPEQSEVLS